MDRFRTTSMCQLPGKSSGGRAVFRLDVPKSLQVSSGIFYRFEAYFYISDFLGISLLMTKLLK